MRSRVTKTELARRVEAVLQLRLLSAEFYDIRREAERLKWNVSDAQLWRYVAKADEAIAQALEKDRGKLIGRAIAQRQALYARCMATADYSTAARILADRDKLLGLYPAEKKEVTGKDGAPMELVVKRLGAGVSMEDL
jgi:hypothetical protein